MKSVPRFFAQSIQNRNEGFVGRDGRRVQVTQFDTSGARVEVVSAPSTDAVAPWAQRWRNPQTKVVGKVRDVREGSMGQSSGAKFVATKQQLPDVDVHVEAMTSTRGLIWRRLWSMWESCLRPGRHWKEQDWPQVPNRRYEEPIKEAKGDESAHPPRIGPSQPTITVQSGRVSVFFFFFFAI